MPTSVSHAKGWAVKRGPRDYEARWYDASGKRRAKVVDDNGTPFTRKADAEKYAKAQAQKVANIRAGKVAAVRPQTVDELLDAFIAGWSLGIGTQKGRPPDPATVKKVKQQLKHLRAKFGSKSPHALIRLD